MSRTLYSILIVFLTCAFANTAITGEIHDAVKNNQLTEVKNYVESGDIELPDRNGLTPLLVATYYGKTAIVKYLCDKGARVDEDDSNGWTSLMYAAYYNYVEIAKILIEHNANMSVRNPKGYTALYYAEKYGHNEIIKMLTPEKQEVKITKIPFDHCKATQDFPCKVAILPWDVNDDSYLYLLLDEIEIFLETNKYFKFHASYYEKSDKNRSLKMVPKRSIWSRGKPNSNDICQLGEQLKIDVILLGSYDESRSHHSTTWFENLKIYLVDIKTEKLFSISTHTTRSGYGDSVESCLSKAFKKYKNDILKTD